MLSGQIDGFSLKSCIYAKNQSTDFSRAVIEFAKVKDTLIILLCGGDKGTQNRDIEKAKEYWQYCKNLV